MAMSIGATDDSAPIADMNTTPLVDVMLVLLILFIITLPVLTHSTNLHIGGGPDNAVVPESITLVIDFDGTIVWNGAVVKDLAQLERYFVVEAGKASQPELHVLPDKRVNYDTVAKVLALAQRSGMQRIGFAGQERFAD
jgi:biopolymer transport protein ExbD